MTADEFPRQLDYGIHLGTAMEAEALDSATPFRIVVLGDFSGRAQRNLLARGEELRRQRPQMIDRDNFDEVMQQLDVRLSRVLVTPDRQSISLKFAEFDDFDPDVLFDKLDLFDSLRDLRRRLLNENTFDEAAREVTAWPGVKEASASEFSTSNNGLNPVQVPVDQLLDQILGEAQQAQGVGEGSIELDLQRVVAEIARPYSLPARDPRQDELVGCVDSAIQAMMTALLQHPHFKQLEADWTALRQLVFDLETGVSMKIYLIDLSKAELSADLLASNDLRETQLYRWLVEQTVETPGGQPWAAVAASYYFGTDSQEIAVLGRLAKLASAAGAPIVAGADGAIVGCPQSHLTPDPDQWQAVASESWKSLQELPEASSLGLLWPRYLLRLPYGESTKSTERFRFEEVSVEGDSKRLLWGNPAILFVNLLGRSFTRSGWNLTLGEDQEVDDLPVWLYQEDGETRALPCGEVSLNEKAIAHVSAFGVMPVISMKDQSVVRIGGFHSVRGTTLQGRWR